MSGIIQVASVIVAAIALSACASNIPQDPRLSGPSDTDLTRMAGAPGAPRIVAQDAAAAPGAARTALRYAATRLPEARGLRFLEISAIPYLRRSPEGAAFLSRAAPRALARGEPPAICPAAGVSLPDATSSEEATRDALENCLSKLQARGADASCGCRVMAIDNALIAPRRDFVFAPGVTAFLIRDGGDDAVRLIAESEPAADGGEVVLLRTAAEVFGTLTLKDESAALHLSATPETTWRGTRRIFGYRRGRLSERIVLSSEDGQTIRLLIGVENRDAVAAR